MPISPVNANYINNYNPQNMNVPNKAIEVQPAPAVLEEQTGTKKNIVIKAAIAIGTLVTLGLLIKKCKPDKVVQELPDKFVRNTAETVANAENKAVRTITENSENLGKKGQEVASAAVKPKVETPVVEKVETPAPVQVEKPLEKALEPDSTPIAPPKQKVEPQSTAPVLPKKDYSNMNAEQLNNEADLLTKKYRDILKNWKDVTYGGYCDLDSDEALRLQKEMGEIQGETVKIRGLARVLETQAKFDRVKDRINLSTTTSVLNKATGEPVEIKIVAEKGGYADYVLNAFDGDKVVGRADVYLDLVYDFPLELLPKNYLNGAKYAEIKVLGASDEYKGIGSELVKAVVRDSKKAGNGGRVALDACNEDLPYRFSKTAESPVPFYEKLGFELCNQASYDEGLMYLTDEGIARIIN